MDLDCLSENVSISGLSDLEKLANAFTIYKKTQLLPDFWLLCKREIDTFCDKQSRFSKTFKNIWTESSFDKPTFVFNYGKFYPILLNDDVITLQENRLWIISTYPIIFFTKFWYYVWTNLKNLIKIRIFQVYTIKSYSTLSWKVDMCIPF